ncbi:MAG: hypothetical protein PHY47_00955 [Lachnospiraceae bacterium]|nr:hypothetical protein [Lachnospiraceae bacterium]
MTNKTRQIEKTFVVIDGKKIPYYRVPPGVSGLTAEVKADLEIKDASAFDADDFETLERDPQLEEEIEGYLSAGNMDDYYAENYFVPDSSKEFENLFDKIEE